MSRYLTLPSDASSNHFSNNTRGSYSTLLAEELVVNGDFEGGICEVFLPVPKYKIKSDTQIHYGKTGGEMRIFVAAKEDCVSNSDLEGMITPLDQNGLEYFRFIIEEDKLKLIVLDGNTIRFGNGPLSELLGLVDKNYTNSKGRTKFITRIKPVYDFVYVYCDVCEYSIVGDHLVPCMRTVPLNRDQTPTVIRFDSVHYIPLTGNRFSTLHVDISDH